MKKIVAVLIVFNCFMFGFTGCIIESPVDQQQQVKQEQMLKDLDKQVGMPNIHEWTEKKLMKRILELRDDSKLICFCYTKNEMTGKYIYEGRCMGYGLPYATQYTNPERIVYNNSNNLPQADPNGLFMPDSADATWIMMINEATGKTEVQYYEPKLVVTQTKKPKRLCEEWSLPNDY